jgi:tRNA A-37 threonylcarbamoyl transferase component Bud32
MSVKKRAFPPSDAPTASFPYRIEAKVGVGSMGVVYRAVEIELDRPVAIKALRASLLDDEPAQSQEEIRRRFQQEAKAAAALSHPSVTTVHRVGETDGVPYIVMEWLEGTTLETVLADQGKLEATLAVRYTLDLLGALDTAHRQGVVHRDIKPANLMILKADGRLKVTDFGIALLRGRELIKTRDGLVLATPKFASPEQLTGSEVDGRADLFATGILLYALLSGVFPFRGSTFMELANAIMLLDTEPLRDLDPRIPAPLDAVVSRALMKDRDDRFPTAEAMAEPLRAWLAEQAVAKRPTHQGAAGTEEDTAWRMPVRCGLPHDPAQAVVRVVESWPSRVLARQSSDRLIDRLLERPLHAPAFAGAVVLGSVCLLLHDGQLLGAIDTTSGDYGDVVASRLPDSVAARLHPVPPMLPSSMIELLATVLSPPQVRIGDLDSSFINLPALADRLRDERFDGILRLRYGKDFGLVLFDGGRAVLSMYSSGWKDIPIEASWQRWVGSVPIRASVEDKVVRPLSLWYRRTLRNMRFDVAIVESAKNHPKVQGTASSSRIRQLIQSPRGGAVAARPIRLMRVSENGLIATSSDTRYEQAPAYRLLSYALRELPSALAERVHSTGWKYLSEWLPLVRKATLYHALPRPGGRETDLFDVVTFDRQDKVLHVMDYLDEATPPTLERFVERVIAAKNARRRTGDIGGAVLVAPAFSDACLEAYAARLAERSASFFSMEEQLTGYAGFVRISARRGFHLLLVQSTDDGRFQALLS